MKKFLKIILFVLLVGFIVIQFFQPEKTNEEITELHFFNQLEVPEEIQVLLTNSCLDCHSSQTRYLWYHHVSPVSWFINDHIIEGREELNLSDWKNLSVLDQISALDEMCEEVENGNMPLKPYLLLHPDAKLSEEEKEMLCEWVKELSEELILKVEL